MPGRCARARGAGAAQADARDRRTRTRRRSPTGSRTSSSTRSRGATTSTPRHRGPRPRDRALPRGRGRGLRRRGRLRRRRHRQRGGERPRRLGHAADLPPRRRDERLLPDARHPDDIVDATEHLLRIADAWAPRRSTSASSTAATSCSPRASGWTPASSSRVDAHPQPEVAPRHWYFAYAGARDVRPGVPRPPAADRRRGRGPDGPRRHVFVQVGDPYTYFSDRPLRVAEDSRSTTARSRGPCCGARRRPTCRRSWPACSRTACGVAEHRRVFAFTAQTAARCVSADGRPVRSRSTATGSAIWSRPASTSSRAG